MLYDTINSVLSLLLMANIGIQIFHDFFIYTAHYYYYYYYCDDNLIHFQVVSSFTQHLFAGPHTSVVPSKGTRASIC